MFMASSFMMSEIASAAINRNLSHSAFRVYVFLSMAADRSSLKGSFVPVGFEEAVRTLPGVKGKPMKISTLRENLRELRRLGLVETAISSEPDTYILVKQVGQAPTEPRKVGSRILHKDTGGDS